MFKAARPRWKWNWLESIINRWREARRLTGDQRRLAEKDQPEGEKF